MCFLETFLIYVNFNKVALPEWTSSSLRGYVLCQSCCSFHFLCLLVGIKTGVFIKGALLAHIGFLKPLKCIAVKRPFEMKTWFCNLPCSDAPQCKITSGFKLTERLLRFCFWHHWTEANPLWPILTRKLWHKVALDQGSHHWQFQYGAAENKMENRVVTLSHSNSGGIFKMVWKWLLKPRMLIWSFSNCYALKLWLWTVKQMLVWENKTQTKLLMWCEWAKKKILKIFDHFKLAFACNLS